MQRLLIAATAGALGLIGAAGFAQDGGRQLPLEAPPSSEAGQPTETVATPAASDQGPDSPQDTEAAARWARLQAEAEAARERRRLEQERYEQGVRQADEARQRYEADSARHREELERARLADEEYRRQRAAYDAATGNAASASRGAVPAQAQASAAGGTAAAPAAETRQERRARERAEREREREARRANESCEDRNRRNRRRGRVIGGLVGGLAVALADREDRGAVALLAVPAGVVLGDAIARLLDCREQEQAAAATEQAVEQAAAQQAQAGTAGAERGIGTTVAWTSETRPGVTGSSTVTALEQEPGGGECMTVTDIIIIDGQETRAPKRMCRRPPSNRFVRV